jgi:lipoprotein-releasing system ATP-binding protein
MHSVPALELKNVEKLFIEDNTSPVRVIDASSIKIFRGETVALVGPSGCGKTTLLQLCGLLDMPTGGDVVINGINTKSLNDNERVALRRNNVGFVYQMHHLFPEFTVYENVALPLMIKGEENYGNKIRKLLERLNLTDKIKSFPSQLSGGEKQRVAVARAIIVEPSLLLADEPTGNLDKNNSVNVMDLMIEYAREHDSALLVVSHNLELAENFDRIITLSNKLIKTIK